MPLPPPEQQVPPLAVNDPRSRSLSLGGLSAGSSPNDHGNNRPRAGSVSSVDPRGNSAGSSSSSQGGLSPRPPHTGGPLPGGHALWPGLDGGGESVVEHLGEHSGSGSAVDDDNEEEEEAEEEVLHSDRSGSHGSRGSGLELPQDTSGAHGDMDAPLNEVCRGCISMLWLAVPVAGRLHLCPICVCVISFINMLEPRARFLFETLPNFKGILSDIIFKYITSFFGNRTRMTTTNCLKPSMHMCPRPPEGGF